MSTTEQPPAPEPLQATAIPIAQLSPTVDRLAESVVRATVTLVWPYSSSTKSLSLLLSEPDFRLRRANGQVKVVFHGIIAENVARSQVGIGDSVCLGLAGSRFLSNDASVQTPGKCVGWDVHFDTCVFLEISRSSEHLSTVKIDPPSSPVANADPTDDDVPPPATPVAKVQNGFTEHTSLPGLGSWQSPAFAERSRKSYGGLVDSVFDPFTEEDGFVPGKGRKRPRFSIPGGDWRVIDEPESPGEKDVPADWSWMFDEEETMLDHEEEEAKRKDKEAQEKQQAQEAETRQEGPPAPVQDGGADVPMEEAPPNDTESKSEKHADQTGNESAQVPQYDHIQPSGVFRHPSGHHMFGDLANHPTDTPRLHPIPSPGLPIPSPLVTNSNNSLGYFASVAAGLSTGVPTPQASESTRSESGVLSTDQLETSMAPAEAYAAAASDIIDQSVALSGKSPQSAEVVDDVHASGQLDNTSATYAESNRTTTVKAVDNEGGESAVHIVKEDTEQDVHVEEAGDEENDIGARKNEGTKDGGESRPENQSPEEIIDEDEEELSAEEDESDAESFEGSEDDAAHISGRQEDDVQVTSEGARPADHRRFPSYDDYESDDREDDEMGIDEELSDEDEEDDDEAPGDYYGDENDDVVDSESESEADRPSGQPASKPAEPEIIVLDSDSDDEPAPSRAPPAAQLAQIPRSPQSSRASADTDDEEDAVSLESPGSEVDETDDYGERWGGEDERIEEDMRSEVEDEQMSDEEVESEVDDELVENEEAAGHTQEEQIGEEDEEDATSEYAGIDEHAEIQEPANEVVYVEEEAPRHESEVDAGDMEDKNFQDAEMDDHHSIGQHSEKSAEEDRETTSYQGDVANMDGQVESEHPEFKMEMEDLRNEAEGKSTWESLPEEEARGAQTEEVKMEYTTAPEAQKSTDAPLATGETSTKESLPEDEEAQGAKTEEVEMEYTVAPEAPKSTDAPPNAPQETPETDNAIPLTSETTEGELTGESLPEEKDARGAITEEVEMEYTMAPEAPKATDASPNAPQEAPETDNANPVTSEQEDFIPPSHDLREEHDVDMQISQGFDETRERSTSVPPAPEVVIDPSLQETPTLQEQQVDESANYPRYDQAGQGESDSKAPTKHEEMPEDFVDGAASLQMLTSLEPQHVLTPEPSQNALLENDMPLHLPTEMPPTPEVTQEESTDQVDIQQQEEPTELPEPPNESFISQDDEPKQEPAAFQEIEATTSVKEEAEAPVTTAENKTGSYVDEESMHSLDSVDLVDLNRQYPGLRSKLSYFAPLATLVDHFHALVDTISIVTNVHPVAQSTSGKKDWFLTLQVTDPSMAGMPVTAQIFRPYKEALPCVEEGDAILLRSFLVKSFQHTIMLTSVDTSSAWAVFNQYTTEEAQIKGPPVEYGREEVKHATDLRQWYLETGIAMIADHQLQASIEFSSREETPSSVGAASDAGSLDVDSDSALRDVRADSALSSSRGSNSRRRRSHRRVTIHQLRDGRRYTEVGSPSGKDGIHELRDGTVYANL